MVDISGGRTASKRIVPSSKDDGIPARALHSALLWFP